MQNKSREIRRSYEQVKNAVRLQDAFASNHGPWYLKKSIIAQFSAEKISEFFLLVSNFRSWMIF